MWIIQVIFLSVGISSLRQLNKVKNVDTSDCAHVPENAVFKWKRNKLASLRLYIIAGIWLVVLPTASMLIELLPTEDGSKSADPAAVVFNHVCVILMFILGMIGFAYECNARKIAKIHNIGCADKQ